MVGRGACACVLAFLLMSSAALAHGGVPIDRDKCVLRFGSDLIHFTVYQPRDTQQEFCEDIPSVGPTIIVLDEVNPELREMTTEVRVVKAAGKSIIGHRLILSDEELTPENLDPITVYYLPARRYPSGTVNFEHVFTEAGRYIGIVTVRNEHGQVYVSQFPFTVGRGWLKVAPYYAVLLALFAGMIGYWKYGGRLFAHAQSWVGRFRKQLMRKQYGKARLHINDCTSNEAPATDPSPCFDRSFLWKLPPDLFWLLLPGGR